MILVIVSFTQQAWQLRDPSPHTGLYWTLTDEESVLEFHRQNQHEMPIGNGLFMRMNAFFFSQCESNKFRTYRYLDKKFRPIDSIPDEGWDRIVVCEV